MRVGFCLLLGFLMAQPPAWAGGSAMARAQTAIEAGHYDQAQALLQNWLKGHRKNQEARFLLARVFSWQGKYPAALLHYDLLLRRSPTNVDYLLGKAQTLFWASQPDAALPLLQRARALSTDYEDVWRLEIRVLSTLGKQNEAQALTNQASQKFPRSQWNFPQISQPSMPLTTRPENMPASDQALEEMIKPVTVPERSKLPQPNALFVAPAREMPAEVEMGFSHDNLDKGYANWRSSYIEAEKKRGERQVVYGALRETERFSLTDTEWLGGFSHPLGPRWTAIVEANASPTHHVLPKWSALGQIQYALEDGWSAHIGVRHTEYNNALTNLGIFTLERYWENYRFAYSHYESFLLGQGSAASNRLQISRYYNEHSWIGLSISEGNELENIGTAGVLAIPAHSLVLGGRHWLSPNWGLTYEAGFYRQGDYYTRNGVRLGLRRQF